MKKSNMVVMFLAISVGVLGIQNSSYSKKWIIEQKEVERMRSRNRKILSRSYSTHI